MLPKISFFFVINNDLQHRFLIMEKEFDGFIVPIIGVFMDSALMLRSAWRNSLEKDDLLRKTLKTAKIHQKFA